MAAVAEAVELDADAEARLIRDRYHWTEVDLCDKGGWLKDWFELNLDDQTLYENADYRVRLRNCYRDGGECLLHARKGKVFATYNLDLMVKWHAAPSGNLASWSWLCSFLEGDDARVPPPRKSSKTVTVSRGFTPGVAATVPRNINVVVTAAPPRALDGIF